MGSCAEVQHQLPETMPPSSPESFGGCGSGARGGQWAAYARRLRGSPTPSSSSRSSATTADTFLLEDVSGFCFPFFARYSFCLIQRALAGLKVFPPSFHLLSALSHCNCECCPSWMTRSQRGRGTSWLIPRWRTMSWLGFLRLPPHLIRALRPREARARPLGDRAGEGTPSALSTVYPTRGAVFR
jgi:hypothetical protein